MMILQEAICTFSFSPHIFFEKAVSKLVTCLRFFFGSRLPNPRRSSETECTPWLPLGEAGCGASLRRLMRAGEQLRFAETAKLCVSAPRPSSGSLRLPPSPRGRYGVPSARRCVQKPQLPTSGRGKPLPYITTKNLLLHLLLFRFLLRRKKPAQRSCAGFYLYTLTAPSSRCRRGRRRLRGRRWPARTGPCGSSRCRPSSGRS